MEMLGTSINHESHCFPSAYVSPSSHVSYQRFQELIRMKELEKCWKKSLSGQGDDFQELSCQLDILGEQTWPQSIVTPKDGDVSDTTRT